MATGPDGTSQRVLGPHDFFNLGPGPVRQLWEQSTDEGKTWTVAFDGLYVRERKAGSSDRRYLSSRCMKRGTWALPQSSVEASGRERIAIAEAILLYQRAQSLTVPLIA